MGEKGNPVSGMTEDELIISVDTRQLTVDLIEAAGGKWKTKGNWSYLVFNNRTIVERNDIEGGRIFFSELIYAESKDLLQSEIYPAIEKKGKWKEFCDSIQVSFWETDPDCNFGDVPEYGNELINYLLKSPARKMAELALRILSSSWGERKAHLASPKRTS